MLQSVPSNKDAMLTVKVAPEVLKEFKIAAELEGGTMSSIVHMFVVRKIRDWKERSPDAFKRRNDSERPVVRAKIGKAKKSRQANG
jgi:hypothetical protein